MKKVIVLELHGFQVSKSMKIKYINDIDLYIYPKEFFNGIRNINNIIQDLNTTNIRSNTIQLSNLLKFDIGNERYSYLICELSIEFYAEDIVIIQRLIDFLEIFLKINTFLFDFFISISRIFLLEKTVSNFKLIRVIEQNIRINKNRTDTLSYKYEGYSRDISTLFNRINDSDLLKKIPKLFYEYGAASDTDTLEVHFSLLWNYFEHLVNLYANNVNRNLIINQNIFMTLKEQISALIKNTLETTLLIPLNLEFLKSEIGRLLNQLKTELSLPLNEESWRLLKNQIREKINFLIQDEDILIEGYDKEKISNILIQQISHFPPIKELIKIVLKNINYILQPRENQTIEIMYDARNHFYHHTIELDVLFQRIVSKYEEITQFNVNSLKAEIKYFKKFLRKVTGKFFHTRLFENLKDTSSIVSFWDQHYITGENNANEYFINKLKTVEKTYCRKKKYVHLLKFILRKMVKYENDFRGNREFEGICFEVENPEYIVFQLNFENKFHAQGTFQGRIGYPRVYRFFINLKTELRRFPSILKFKEIIYMSLSSNRHNVYIRILDYWSNCVRALEQNNYLLDNLI